jgi:thioredoxin-related protein
MKKLLLLSTFFLIIYAGFSQTSTQKNNAPTYISNPVIPEFTVYKAPDSISFTKENLHKKKSTLIMVFSPECGHCQHVTTLLLNDINHFKNTQILMTTWLPYNEMISFYNTYKIADYPQITMAWDKKDFFLPYYHVQSFPMLIAYDKKGKLINTFDGNVKMETIWKAIDDAD